MLMTLDLRGWINFTEVCSICASCRVLEKQFLSVEDSVYMAMLTGNNSYAYTESRLFCKSCARSTTYRVFNPCNTTLKSIPYMEG